MNAPDFFLASTDYYTVGNPRRVWRVKRMSLPGRDDVLLVKVDPPIVHREGLAIARIEYVLLATRHQGTSLFPIIEFPTSVYVIRPLIQDVADRSDLSNGEFESIAWAEVYLSEEQARQSCR